MTMTMEQQSMPPFEGTRGEAIKPMSLSGSSVGVHGVQDTLQKSTKQMDDELVHEMNKLSVQQRIAALEDMHGVAGAKQEDIQMVTKKLKEMDLKLRGTSGSTAYQIVQKTNPAYLQNIDFRLMFLRADDFDVGYAIKRMHKFLDYKLELFGEEKLCRDITLNDLDSDDRAALEAGAFQELSERDRSGRTVVVVFHQLRHYKHKINLYRAYFYFSMSVVSGRPDVQKDGIVFVYYNTSESPQRPNVSLVLNMFRLRHALPFRNATSHFCLRHESKLGLLQTLMQVWWYFNGTFSKVRNRKHYGSDCDIHYRLRGYGFPMDVFPINADGTVDLSHHFRWIKLRSQIEGPVDPPDSRSLDTSHHQQFFDASTDLLEPSLYFFDAKQEATMSTTPNEPPMDSLGLSMLPNSFSPEIVESLGSQQIMASSQMLSMGVQQQQQPQHQQMQPIQNAGNPLNNGKMAVGHDNLRMGFFQNNAMDLQQNLQQQHPPQQNMLGSLLSGMMGTEQALPPAADLSSPYPPAASASLGETMPPSNGNNVWVVPRSEDVLFGRGKPTRNHPGNVRFRELLEQHAEEYNKAPKFVKAVLSKKLVETVIAEGARFLRPTSGNGQNLWVLADHKHAANKVSQYFRSRRGEQNKANKESKKGKATECA